MENDSLWLMEIWENGCYISAYNFPWTSIQVPHHYVRNELTHSLMLFRRAPRGGRVALHHSEIGTHSAFGQSNKPYCERCINRLDTGPAASAVLILIASAVLIV